MFQVTITIADTHLHAVQTEEKHTELNIKVFATDLRTGHCHITRMTQLEFCALAAVALTGENFDLPSTMTKFAADLVTEWPAECRPIP